MHANQTKKWLIVLLGVILGLTLFGCKDETTTSNIIDDPDAIIPALSHPDAIYYQGDGFSVTYQDLYEEIKVNDGLNQLLMMIDEDLLATEIAAVTSGELTDKINELTYGTSDLDEIAKMTEEEKDEAERLYLENLTILGYEDNAEPYLRLVIAREKYARAQMLLTENSSQSWYVGVEKIATEYADNFQPDLQTIKIRFTSEPDARGVMESLNLVGRNDGFLYRYTGTKPIAEVTKFDQTNTVKLTNDEVIDAFIAMYNLVYGTFRDEISLDATVTELVAIPELNVVYKDLYQANPSLTNFMYKSLGTLEAYEADDTTALYYTYVPAKYYGSNDTSYYMICNLAIDDKADLTDFAGDETALKALIGSDVYESIKTTKIDTNLSATGFISGRLKDLRNGHEFQLNDFYLAIDYQSVDADYEMEGNGHETVVATYGEVSITADQLLTYAMNQNAPLYLLYASQLGALKAGFFADVYCPNPEACETDVTKNTSLRMAGHLTELQSIKAQFEESYYSYYYTFEEYIYLAFGAKSELDMIERYYIRSTLQPLMIYDLLTKNDWALFQDYFLDYVDDYYDNYLDVYVNHLLIYVDRDENGSPDDYDLFLENLDDLPAYETLLADFQEAILAYLDDDTSRTFSSLISTYNKARRSDATWGTFKANGLALMTENLSSQGPLTYLSSKDTFDPKFVEGLIAAYGEYSLPENVVESNFRYDTFIDTSFGSHLLYLTPGTVFERPSAEFAMTYDKDDNPKFIADFVNANPELSLAQLKAYATARVMELAYGTDEETLTEMEIEIAAIPTSVKTCIDQFFITIYDSVFAVGTINHILVEEYFDGTILHSQPSYCTMTSDDVLAGLQELGDIYYHQVFVPFESTAE